MVRREAEVAPNLEETMKKRIVSHLTYFAPVAAATLFTMGVAYVSLGKYIRTPTGNISQGDALSTASIELREWDKPAASLSEEWSKPIESAPLEPTPRPAPYHPRPLARMTVEWVCTDYLGQRLSGDSPPAVGNSEKLGHVQDCKWEAVKDR
jgi:hypothetical protein